MTKFSVLLMSLTFALSARGEAPTGFRVVPKSDIAFFISERFERIVDLEVVNNLRLPQATAVAFVRESRENRQSQDWVKEFITQITAKYALNSQEGFTQTVEDQAVEHFLDHQEAFMTALLTLKNEEIGKEMSNLFSRIAKQKSKR